MKKEKNTFLVASKTVASKTNEILEYFDKSKYQPERQNCPECGSRNTGGLDEEYIHCNECGYEGPPTESGTKVLYTNVRR